MDQIATLRWYPKFSTSGASAVFQKHQIQNGVLDKAIDGLLFDGVSFSVTFGPDKEKKQKTLPLV